MISALLRGRARSTQPSGRVGRPLVLLPFLLVLSALSGCGAVVGAGAATGVAAYQERGVEGKARDLRTEIEIFERWLRKDHTYSTKMSIEVYEGRVMLTGVVDDAAIAADAVQLAWQVPGVKQVLNEIQVAGGGDLIDYARDALITATLKSKLTLDDKIFAINYAIETVNGVVYLIGIALNRAEMDRVLGHTRNIKYVRRIINHVRVKDPS